MAMNMHSCNNTTVENLMEKAKELLYTIQGELFDGKENLIFDLMKFKVRILARIIPNLCQYFNLTATLHHWTNITDLIECLNSHHVCLVP
jgi:hypothetical protein